MEIIMKEITYYTNNSNTLKTNKKNSTKTILAHLKCRVEWYFFFILITKCAKM